MPTLYKFNFCCAKCGLVNHVTYRVPETSGVWSKLTCKGCERPLISIMLLRIDHGIIFNDIHYYYKVYDDSRDRYLLGAENDSVKRDVFWNWVVDHGGDRFED